MLRKILSVLLALACMACIFTGCDAVGEIAGNVLEAAGEELKQQVQNMLEEHKVEVVELKTAVGKLNDEGGELQFFCAALIRTNSEDSAQDCASAMDTLFEETGFTVQTGTAVESGHLVHKSITYKHGDYSEGNYYTVYMYTSDVSKIIDLNALTEKLKNNG